MTPLEEIEQAIAEINVSKMDAPADDLAHDAITAALYQARAIERLNMILKTIWQEYQA